MASPQEFVTALEHMRIVVYFNVASTALLVFDYFLTFPSEVELIWPAHWTTTKVMFLISRYLPFVDVAFLFYSEFLIGDVKNCMWVYRSNAWLFYSGTCLTEIILTMRTWAVWNRDKRLGICLAVFFALCWIPSIAVIVVFNNSLDFMLISSPTLLGCLMIKGSRIAFVCWVLLLVYEFGIFSLMLLKAVQCYKSGGMTGLSLVVFRDGLLYYLYLFAFSITNVTFMGSLPPSLQNAMVLAERVIHPILACRVVLDLRSYLSTQHINMPPTAAMVILPSSQESTNKSDRVGTPGEVSTLINRSSLSPDADKSYAEG